MTRIQGNIWGKCGMQEKSTFLSFTLASNIWRKVYQRDIVWVVLHSANIDLQISFVSKLKTGLANPTSEMRYQVRKWCQQLQTRDLWVGSRSSDHWTCQQLFFIFPSGLLKLCNACPKLKRSLCFVCLEIIFSLFLQNFVWKVSAENAPTDVWMELLIRTKKIRS